MFTSDVQFEQSELLKAFAAGECKQGYVLAVLRALENNPLSDKAKTAIANATLRKLKTNSALGSKIARRVDALEAVVEAFPATLDYALQTGGGGDLSKGCVEYLSDIVARVMLSSAVGDYLTEIAESIATKAKVKKTLSRKR